eukprot:CAMPEP_0206578968 /NCGR_PEP_ID=MMETSP0325_2-20121206/32275_1 /ASSEMBLY_ACC=CAM_ASM_000347 /TAXON_ID=2866 /ORGANISM="Crypthecodinium cohnii, Strain Seligo" /LENGTH=248 /DNA_ID=CAMNT_0054084701 /DNA_START=409 /DNA_END=1152 /DNA_ORIENTATION=-
MLDCDDSEEWTTFRKDATEAVARGFELSKHVEGQAERLEEKYRHWVCKETSAGNACETSDGFSHNFVRDLHLSCIDSNNFERYLVRHYFTNSKTEFVPLYEPSGFCLFGYITALLVLAWHSYSDYIGQAMKYLIIAHHLLGHYHSFDYLESSSWPIRSFLLLVNFMQGSPDWIPMLEPPEYTHPGQRGDSWYLEQLQWFGTAEASKNSAWAVAGSDSHAMSLLLPRHFASSNMNYNSNQQQHQQQQQQ